MERQELENTIVTFFPRLEGIGGLLRALTGYSPLRVVVEIRGTPNRILLDLASPSFQITVGGPGLQGVVCLAGSPEDLHQTFSGDMAIMEGIAQRRLLLTGSMGNLVLMFPVVDQIPVLYGEHLESLDANRRKPGPIRRWLACGIERVAGVFVYLVGRVLRGLGRHEILKVLASMSYGAARFSGRVRVMKPEVPSRSSSNPLDEPRPSLWRAFLMWTLSWKMYRAGWFVSLLKHRMGVPVDVFRVMERFSSGVDRGQLPERR